jgi:hypothetical protein
MRSGLTEEFLTTVHFSCCADGDAGPSVAGDDLNNTNKIQITISDTYIRQTLSDLLDLHHDLASKNHHE